MVAIMADYSLIDFARFNGFNHNKGIVKVHPLPPWLKQQITDYGFCDKGRCYDNAFRIVNSGSSCRPKGFTCSTCDC